jgi:hypothetical protein
VNQSNTEHKQAVHNHLPAVSNPPRLLYPRKDSAYQIGVSIRAVDYLIARGELRVRRIGGRVLVPHAELVKFAARDHPTLLVSVVKAQKAVV